MRIVSAKQQYMALLPGEVDEEVEDGQFYDYDEFSDKDLNDAVYGDEDDEDLFDELEDETSEAPAVDVTPVDPAYDSIENEYDDHADYNDSELVYDEDEYDEWTENDEDSLLEELVDHFVDALEERGIGTSVDEGLDPVVSEPAESPVQHAQLGDTITGTDCYGNPVSGVVESYAFGKPVVDGKAVEDYEISPQMPEAPEGYRLVPASKTADLDDFYVPENVLSEPEFASLYHRMHEEYNQTGDISDALMDEARELANDFDVDQDWLLQQILN